MRHLCLSYNDQQLNALSKRPGGEVRPNDMLDRPAS
jgi:hypothetical protein